MTDGGNFAEILDEYLRAVEAGDAPDRAALLAAHPDLAEELQAALLGVDFVHAAAPRLAPEEDTDAQPGRSLGDYRLLRELGRGGMAVVYEAEQISLARRVALKVLPFAAVLDPKQLQRFKNEALAAAHLHHPNIVPVYGVGCERGVHYYAMQYVEGQSLATAIRDMKGERGSMGDGPKTPISSHGSNREPAYIRMAAALGVQAAEALDHAHQLGIVHRDVKPGNLLADLAGTLWVTDFGLASSMKDVSLTITGELLGTIRYMSPEQALAKRVPIDHRTDIYSLGATLYELFTLEPAFPGDDPHRVIQDIASREPVLPRRLNPALPRDLETVLLKAMWKDPSGRYATAQEMADDLTRFLENRPIEAKRPGLFRRASKWSRRHRTLVGATVVLLLLSTAGLATGTALLWREQAQTKSAFDSAQANLRLALEALDQIYIDEAEGYPKIREGLPRDLLEKGLGFYEQFVKENAGNKGLVILMGNACHRAGLIFRELGEEDRAVESLEGALSAYDRAIEFDPQNAIARIKRSNALSALGRFEEALAACDRAIEIDPRFAAAHGNRGNVLEELGRFEEALAAHDRAIEIDPRNAVVHSNRGIALLDLGRFDEALAACDRAIEIDPRKVAAHSNRGHALHELARFEEALAAHDRAIEIDPRNAMAHSNRGIALLDLGRFDEALAAFDRAIEIDPRYAAAHTNRGAALSDLGRFEEALAASDRAIEIDPRGELAHTNRGGALSGLGCFEEAVVAYDRAIEIDPRDAIANINRGNALLKLRRFEESLAASDRAIEIDPRGAIAHINRGNALGGFGRFEEALAAFDRAIEIDPRNAFAHSNRGDALYGLGRFEESLAACDRAIEIDPRFAAAHSSRGNALYRLGRFEESLAACDRAIEIDPRYAAAHSNRGYALVELGRFDEALAACDRAIEIDPRNAMAHINRGAALRRLGRFDDALAASDRAIEIDPRIAAAHSNRGSVLRGLGRFEDALAACDRAIEIDPRFAAAQTSRGNVLRDLGRSGDALAAYDRAIEIDPRSAAAYYNRGAVLHDLGRSGDALAAWDRVLEIDPRNADAHYNRGSELLAMGENEAAIGAYREAIRLRPDDALAHCSLGQALMLRGRFQEAVPCFRRGHELGSRRADWAYPSGKSLEDAERKAELEGRLDQVLSGEARPRDAVERIEFASLLYFKAHNSESARMYAEAFAEDAALAEDLAEGHRYNAACSAALASAPGGADAAEWRGRTLEWLRADLAAREKAATGLAATLEHWKKDSDLASVRDRLGDLPDPERAAWGDLWAAVDLALAAARPAAK